MKTTKSSWQKLSRLGIAACALGIVPCGAALARVGGTSGPAEAAHLRTKLAPAIAITPAGWDAVVVHTHLLTLAASSSGGHASPTSRSSSPPPASTRATQTGKSPSSVTTDPTASEATGPPEPIQKPTPIPAPGAAAAPTATTPSVTPPPVPEPIQPATITSSGGSSIPGLGGGEKTLSGCMALWEPALHMSKPEWRATCKRTLNGLDMPIDDVKPGGTSRQAHSRTGTAPRPPTEAN